MFLIVFSSFALHTTDLPTAFRVADGNKSPENVSGSCGKERNEGAKMKTERMKF